MDEKKYDTNYDTVNIPGCKLSTSILIGVGPWKDQDVLDLCERITLLFVGKCYLFTSNLFVVH